MDKTIIARWRDWPGNSIEHLVLKETGDGINADSVIILKDDGNPYAARYQIIRDKEWGIRSVGVELL